MNELLEKARRDYPIGTKVKSVYKDVSYIVSAITVILNEDVYTIDGNGDNRCIYDKEKNKWAEIINQNNMTHQEFNSLKVGDYISNYEILQKFKQFLIVRCDDGHDLFDLSKINKLGLKVKPKTFMGLEIKKYDSVPCEINGKELYYLFEAFETKVSISNSKYDSVFYYVPTSIRIL